MVISIKQLLEAGVQFGHPTRQWNPKMSKYIFCARNDTHIIDLEQSVVLVEQAYEYVRDMASKGKSILFVGTKKQASEAIKEEAERCGMYYVNTRWLGGTLTNFKTIRTRVERLNKLNKMEQTGEFEFFPKKEVLQMKAERDKLEKNLGGIKDMTSLPGLLFVVDLKKEHIAIKEAKALGIPVVGLVDTNCDPTLVDVVIPGNDDAIRSVRLIAEVMANAVIEAKNGNVPEVEKEQAEVTETFNEDGEAVAKRVFKKKEEKADAPKKAPVKKTAKKETAEENKEQA
ncbi:MAG: 30S ribosomal protein S2 [Clostridia bacterium]|nr:30S ribosomal protein S2 [Clostridia bacterium]